jgi:periplasmic divalent cation tolerance protein
VAEVENNMITPIVAISTCGSVEEARRIAHDLTELRLAACVNILPAVTSVYRWKGAVEEAQEVMLVIKTRAGLVDRLSARLRQLHSYEVPELILVPVTGGLPAYLQWIHDETESAPPALG